MKAKFPSPFKSRAALAVTLLILAVQVALTEAQSNKSLDRSDLIGTWVLSGENGVVSEPAGALRRLKSITDGHWSITQADPKSGLVIFHHGGTYALKGDEYVETVEYANASTTNLVGQTFRFKVKIDGDTLSMTGIGNPWNEVWKRGEGERPVAPKPKSSGAKDAR